MPASGATDAYYRAVIEFQLSEADPTATARSADISGSTRRSDDGRTVTFVPDDPLAHSTAYTVILATCAGSTSLSFITSELGAALADPESLTGRRAVPPAVRAARRAREAAGAATPAAAARRPYVRARRARRDNGSAMPTVAPSRRAAWKPALRVVGFAGLVALVAWRVDPAVVAASWRGASALELTGIVVLFCAAMAVRVAKWALQLRALGFDFAAPALTRNFLLAVLLGAVTPMRVGEAYRVGAVRLDPERRLEQLAVVGASLLLEKAYEVLGLLVLVAVGLLAAGGAGAAGLVAVLAPIAVGAVFGLLPVGPPRALVTALPERIRAYAVAPLLRARDGLGARGRLGVFGLTVLAHALNYAGGLGVYRLFGPMPTEVFLTRAPVVTLSNVLPVSIGGFGVRETAAMELFGRVGYPASSAAVAASLMFLCANLVPMLAWPLLLAWERLDGAAPGR